MMAGIDAVICAYWRPRKELTPHRANRVFDPSWVYKLQGMCRRCISGQWRFICLTDDPAQLDDSVHALRFTDIHPPGWPWLMDVWRRDLGYSKALFMGLDTVICGNIDELCDFETDLMMPRNPDAPKLICTGVILMTPQGGRRIWDTWRVNPAGIVDSAKHTFTWSHPFSDLKFVNHVLQGRPQHWMDDEFPGLALGYHQARHATGQKELRDLPDGCRIVYFYGEPKQHQLGHLSWVKENWR